MISFLSKNIVSALSFQNRDRFAIRLIVPENLAENQEKNIKSNMRKGSKEVNISLQKSNVYLKKPLVITLWEFFLQSQMAMSKWASWTTDRRQWKCKQSVIFLNSSKWDFYKLQRQKVSSFSVSLKTRDQLELSHHYGSSGLWYSIHTPKLVAGRALDTAILNMY